MQAGTARRSAALTAMSKSKIQTLAQALYLARSGESKNLRLAAAALDGLAPNDGPADGARSDILGWLPHRTLRAYSMREFIAATNSLNSATGRYVAQI